MKKVIVACLLAIATYHAMALQRSVITVNVQGANISVYLYEPDGAGKFPLLILSHGSPRNAADRGKFGAGTLHVEAEAYASSGVAVAVPIRRGYGGNGAWVEGFAGSHPDYYIAGLTSADDIGTAIASLSKRPEIDASRIVLMGVSAGGWASVAEGTRRGVLGVINFAGGRGSSGPGHVAGEPELIHAAALYGAEGNAAELWIYSENDQFFGPVLARSLFDAFTGAGGHATFIAAPPYGDDGHQYINNVNSWKPEVDSFLRKIGFFQSH